MRRSLIPIMLGLAALVVWLYAASVPRAVEVGWLVMLWGSALAACALVSSGRTRGMSALTSVGVIAALASVADGAARAPIVALMLVVLAAAVATLLEVAMFAPDIIITETDSDRLTRLLDVLPDAQRAAVADLESELARAHVVPPRAVPRDVVTMNSRVVFEDAESGKRTEARLVYPHDSKLDAGAVSVLAPVGSALLGMRTGQWIDWRMPSGRLKRYRVLDVPYQPEAAGDFHL
ncbi:MAG: nucleoside diphosphate kinase regulator [Polyangiales bacterium]